MLLAGDLTVKPAHFMALSKREHALDRPPLLLLGRLPGEIVVRLGRGLPGRASPCILHNTHAAARAEPRKPPGSPINRSRMGP